MLNQKRSVGVIAIVAHGGYVLSEESGALKIVIIATGSEVPLAVAAQRELDKHGIAARVVSMPCTQAFDRQHASYCASVLPAGVPRISVEAGVTDYWRKYVGLDGATMGIDTFGESAPVVELYQHFGLTVERIVDVAISLLSASPGCDGKTLMR